MVTGSQFRPAPGSPTSADLSLHTQIKDIMLHFGGTSSHFQCCKTCLELFTFLCPWDTPLATGPCASVSPLCGRTPQLTPVLNVQPRLWDFEPRSPFSSKGLLGNWWLGRKPSEGAMVLTCPLRSLPGVIRGYHDALDMYCLSVLEPISIRPG